MKKIFLFLSLVPATSYATAPATSCPSGYATIDEKSMVVANSTCPSGYVSAGSITTCLATNPAGSCMMYVSTGTTYTDTTGSYEFTEICPLI